MTMIVARGSAQMEGTAPPPAPPPRNGDTTLPLPAFNGDAVSLPPLQCNGDSGTAQAVSAPRNGDSIVVTSPPSCNGDHAVAAPPKGNVVELTSEPLDLCRYLKAVEDRATGAVAIFQGVTRDRFEGKKVARLEYEAYEGMAIPQLHEICQEARKQWPVAKIAIAHRTGVVEVGETAVIVVISSVHRREALDAVGFTIEEIKKKVAIWKKEIYEEGEGTWKENEEFNRMRGSLAGSVR